MSPQEFLVEEYKQRADDIRDYQAAYRRLESFTFGGVLVIYGFLLTNLGKIPTIVWWLVPILIGISAVRCFAYYLILTWRYAPYVKRLEAELYEGRDFGFQAFIDKHRVGRTQNLIFNAFGWVTLMSLSVIAAFWRMAAACPTTIMD